MLTLVSSNDQPLTLAPMTLEEREKSLADIKESVEKLSQSVVKAYEAGDTELANMCFNTLKAMAELSKAQRSQIEVERRRASFVVVG